MEVVGLQPELDQERARIANLKAEGEHQAQEIDQLSTELERAHRPWWRRLFVLFGQPHRHGRLRNIQGYFINSRAPLPIAAVRLRGGFRMLASGRRATGFAFPHRGNEANNSATISRKINIFLYNLSLL